MSKVITEYMTENDSYEKIKKVYSINILYFDLGQGRDYVYHGKTSFVGIHEKDYLTLSAKQAQKFNKNLPDDLFPEIFLLKVNNFNNVAKDTLDEWIYFFKNTDLPKNYKAKGLKQVENKLKYEQMDNATKLSYDAYNKHLMVSKSMIETAKFEGKIEGKIEGIKESKKEIVLALNQNGLSADLISKYVGLTVNEVNTIIANK